MGKRGPVQLPRVERFRERTAEGPAPAHRPELGPCLLWTGTTFEDRGGYGSFYDDDQRLKRAHRVAWEIETGETLTPDEHVLHHCDVPPCVRFRHLYLGDQAVNMDDMRGKGRGFVPPPEPGALRYNAQLTDAIVLAARRRYAAGEEVREIVAGSPYRIALRNAIYGRSWNHVEMPSYESRERKRGQSAARCPQGHDFTPENTGYVIDKDGYRNRYCKQCNRDRARRYAHKRRR